MDDDILKLLDEQFKLFSETGDKIIENVLEFHRDSCDNQTEVCERGFVTGFMILFEQKMMEDRQKKMDAMLDINLN